MLYILFNTNKSACKFRFIKKAVWNSQRKKERKMWTLTIKVQMDWCGERPFGHQACLLLVFWAL